MKVKICGITNLEDARASVAAGCAALGFVFYKRSPRYIAPPKARRIIRHLAPGIIKVGVFVNATEKAIRRIAGLCGLDMLQLHGQEPPELCKRLSDYKVIKVFRVKDKIDLEEISKYRAFAYLFDTFVKSKMGGTGRKFDWRLLEAIGRIKQPVFLSGGLNKRNVREAVRLAHPEWIDVSSSLEERPGKKSHKKLKSFMAALKIKERMKNAAG